MENSILQLGGLSLSTITREVYRDLKEIDLTNREFELLKYFLEHPNQVLTRDQLKTNVFYQTEYAHGSNIVDVYITYLRKKIDKGFQLKMIISKKSVGYMFRYKSNRLDKLRKNHCHACGAKQLDYN